MTVNGPNLSDYDFFGSSVANLGDLDGDGTTDVAVGAIYDRVDLSHKGAIYIIFLNPNSTPKSTR